MRCDVSQCNDDHESARFLQQTKHEHDIRMGSNVFVLYTELIWLNLLFSLPRWLLPVFQLYISFFQGSTQEHLIAIIGRKIDSGR